MNVVWHQNKRCQFYDIKKLEKSWCNDAYFNDFKKFEVQQS